MADEPSLRKLENYAIEYRICICASAAASHDYVRTAWGIPLGERT
jgi:hypothetical protein